MTLSVLSWSQGIPLMVSPKCILRFHARTRACAHEQMRVHACTHTRTQARGQKHIISSAFMNPYRASRVPMSVGVHVRRFRTNHILTAGRANTIMQMPMPACDLFSLQDLSNTAKLWKSKKGREVRQLYEECDRCGRPCQVAGRGVCNRLHPSIASANAHACATMSCPEFLAT